MPDGPLASRADDLSFSFSAVGQAGCAAVTAEDVAVRAVGAALPWVYQRAVSASAFYILSIKQPNHRCDFARTGWVKYLVGLFFVAIFIN